MAVDREDVCAGRGPPVEVRDLVTSFGDTVIHDRLSLTVRQGEILGIVGGTGSGKSVLLSVLIGLKRPDAGQVRIFGRDLYGGSRRELADVERRWGVLFQGSALFSNLTVQENVAAPLFESTALPRRAIYELADVKIALAGLPPGAGALKPAQLSGGMIKRAGIARALALDPELLMLDEPTSGLDPVVAGQFDQLVLTLARSLRLTVVLITHDLDTLYTVCDRVAVLAQGIVVALGAMSDLEKSEHPWVRSYFLGARGQAARRAAEARRAATSTPVMEPR